MTILVINSGSSSIKFGLFDDSAHVRLVEGEVAQIGQGQSTFSLRWHGAWSDHENIAREVPVADHAAGLELALDAIEKATDGSAALRAIGHRVVHGGPAFTGPVIVDHAVVQSMARLEPLAPLHNPANTLGIELGLARFPALPQVAVFDTAFHHSLPEAAFRYAVPEAWYSTHQVRRYGFHGTSHAYLVRRAAQLLGRAVEEVNLITLHLGNGASATAVRGGRSVDTSMGFTPLEGLVMGTRSGDLDAAVPVFLQRHVGLEAEQVEKDLNRNSGLKGVSGVSDMREILRRREAGDDRAVLAFEMFCYRIKKYIGAYTAVLGSVDGIVFSGGIGSHQSAVRAQCCQGLTGFGIGIDPARNEGARDGSAIHLADAEVAVLVIETDEEHEIALQTCAVLSAAGAGASH